MEDRQGYGLSESSRELIAIAAEAGWLPSSSFSCSFYFYECFEIFHFKKE